MFPSYLEVQKKYLVPIPAIFRELTNTVAAIWFLERKKWIPAIWRQKNVVHNCQEQGKRL